MQGRQDNKSRCCCERNLIHRAGPGSSLGLHLAYISRKLRIIWWPPSVKTLSGWN
jgi:hypothetical protein